MGRDNRQYDRWRSAVDRRSGRPQQGKTLADLARDLGGVGVTVERSGFEFRN